MMRGTGSKSRGPNEVKTKRGKGKNQTKRLRIRTLRKLSCETSWKPATAEDMESKETREEAGQNLGALALI